MATYTVKKIGSSDGFKRLFLTTRGEPAGKYTADELRDLITIANGNVVVMAARDHYFINGMLLKTDGN